MKLWSAEEYVHQKSLCKTTPYNEVWFVDC